MNWNELRKKFGFPQDLPSLKDSIGRYRTRSLFKENSEVLWVEPHVREEYPPLYTMDDFRRVYVEMEDPTGYATAMIMLGSWEHWEKLCKCSWFAEALEEWNREMEVRLRMKAIQGMKEIVEAGGAPSASAAKWLAEKGWMPKQRGAPSKAEIAKHAKAKIEHDKDVADALDRLGLKQEVKSG